MEFRYLDLLSKVETKLKATISTEELCSDLCSLICSIMRYSEITVARVTIDQISRMSRGFRSTQWGLVHEFKITETTTGCFEIYYIEARPWTSGNPFVKEEEELLNNLAGLLCGAATKDAYTRLLLDYTERLKELGGITSIISILKENRPIQALLNDVCNAIPGAWQYPEYTGARITFGDFVFSTANFMATPWMQKQPFEIPDGPSGQIEVCYTKQFPPCAEGPFLQEERNLIINLAQLISAATGSKLYEGLISQNRERLKELKAINQTTDIITRGKSIDDTLQNISAILTESLQYPRSTVVRISFEGKEFMSSGFRETPWVLREQFITIDNSIGTIEFFYLQEFPDTGEGSPFLREEREMIKNIGRLLAHFLNNFKGRMLMEHSHAAISAAIADRPDHIPSENRDNLLFSIIPQGADISYLVREVLFVAAPYEAFAIQSECMSFRFEINHIHSSFGAIPRITVANTSERALEYLSQKSFDIVIIMVGVDEKSAIDSYSLIIQSFPMLPVYILVNRMEYASSILTIPPSKFSKDNPVFVWNNDPTLLFAIVKLYEDTRNASLSHAPVVLMVEDRPDVVSRIITRLYLTILNWFEENIADDTTKETCQQGLPHLLVVSNFETAVHIVRRFQDRICCLVSDVEFSWGGSLNRNAGIEFVNVLKKQYRNVPCLLHSSDGSHHETALALGCTFVDKSTPAFIEKVSSFVKDCLQINILTFVDESGTVFAKMADICSLMKLMGRVPESLILKMLHKGIFEKWFANHGENFDINEIIHTEYPVESFKEFVKNILRKRFRGTVTRFENVQFFDRSFITTICRGSYGGKGRGAAFINSIVNNPAPEFSFPDIDLYTPATVIIGTSEFEHFLKQSSIREIDLDMDGFDTIQEHFLNITLSKRVRENLQRFIQQVRTPLAVRSSSLFEDSLIQPFAGAFETYIIPNSHDNPEIRLQQLETSVKLVFASLYRPEAKLYFDYAGRNISEERMAVVVQELVGTQIGDHFYPHISGVAGSWNYYPFSHSKPEDGFAAIAFGLGVYVVEGKSAHRFSPAYPDLSFGSFKDLITSSQVKFYAVNTTRKDIDLQSQGEKAGLDLLDLSIAEKSGSLKHCASVYDTENDRIVPNLNLPGPRILDFANILQYKHFSLAESLRVLLNSLEKRMGTPVEIEFAVRLPHPMNSLSKPELNLLQVKPLTGKQRAYELNDSALDPETILLYSQTALGNGLIDTVTDIIMVDLSLFDCTRTAEIANEVEWFNRRFLKTNRHYLLIGPGRWGTRDRSLGIPVAWSQICNAKVIVELGLENYHLDASLGSHFFHNMTSMGTGYMAINESNSQEIIRLDALAHAQLVERQRFVLHYRFGAPLKIEIDGKKRIAIVRWKGTS
ncbi:MAG: hypothetical protein JW915_13455 [Chitinispirillaceae bacterium]|nr:hypothetical protein [Chitinispirillaceae bacterium]